MDFENNEKKQEEPTQQEEGFQREVRPGRSPRPRIHTGQRPNFERPSYNHDNDEGGFRPEGFGAGLQNGAPQRGGYRPRNNYGGGYQQRQQGGYGQQRQGGYQPRNNYGQRPQGEGGYQPRSNYGQRPQGEGGYQPRNNYGQRPQGGYQQHLLALGDKAALLSPDNTLRRGYSLVRNIDQSKCDVERVG